MKDYSVKRGAFIYERPLGIDAYRYARMLNMLATRAVVFLKLDDMSGLHNQLSRVLCRVLYDIDHTLSDYGLKVLSCGLAYPYAAFNILKEYYDMYRTAKETSQGMHELPQEVIKFIMPWKMRSGFNKYNQLVPIYNGKNSNTPNISVRVTKLLYLCDGSRKARSYIYCCITHFKNRETMIEVRTSEIENAGLGIFLKNGKDIKKGDVICTYDDFPSLHPNVNKYYKFEVERAQKTIVYDGFKNRHFQLGPLANDISVNLFCEDISKAVIDKNKDLLEMIVSTSSIYNKKNNALGKTYGSVLALVARTDIKSGSEIFLEYGIADYWFPLILKCVRNEDDSTLSTFLKRLKDIFKSAFILDPKLEQSMGGD